MASFGQGGLISQITTVATSGGVTSLSASSTTIQRFTGTANQTVVLPNAATLKVGRSFYLANRSSGTITVNLSTGTYFRTLNPQDVYILELVNNGTADGIWDQDYAGSVNPLQLFANPSAPDARLYISSNALVQDSTSVITAPPIKGVVPSVPSSYIDFQTQSTGGATFVISFNTGTLGYYRRAALTLLSSGSIQVTFTPEASALVNVVDPAPYFAKGLPLGYVTLQCTNAAGKYKTANSATSVIENSVGGVPTIVSIQTTGTSPEERELIDNLASVLFRASFGDTFSQTPDGNTAIDIGVGKTDVNTYSAPNQYFRLSYDASRTASSSGTALSLSATPSFVPKSGDFVISGSQVRRIASNPSAPYTALVLDSAFVPNLGPATAVCVSQGVYTKDLNNYSGDGQAVASVYSTTIGEVLVNYEDTTTPNDIFFDAGAPNMAFSASSDGTNWTEVYSRPSSILLDSSSTSLPTASTSLYLRFFPKKTSGSGAVNFLSYQVYFHAENSIDQTGFALNQALAFTDGSGSPLNCALSVVGGKTRVTLTFSYTRTLSPGLANGQIEVYLNGQKIPRYVNASLTPDASYTEVNAYTIDLDSDYSGYNFSLEVIKPNAVIDSNNQNRIFITTKYPAIVGSAKQLADGLATHTTINDAVAAVGFGGRIMVLPGTFTAPASITANNIILEGLGNTSVISGALTVAANNCMVKQLRFNSLTINGNYNFIKESWMPSTGSLTDAGVDNVFEVIKEL